MFRLMLYLKKCSGSSRSRSSTLDADARDEAVLTRASNNRS